MLGTCAGAWGIARTKQTSQSHGACMVAEGRQTINKSIVNDIGGIRHIQKNQGQRWILNAEGEACVATS